LLVFQKAHFHPFFIFVSVTVLLRSKSCLYRAFLNAVPTIDTTEFHICPLQYSGGIQSGTALGIQVGIVISAKLT